MASKRFRDSDVQLALLWCDRHCCLCGKQCSAHIETHHIDPKEGNDLDNCLPVCYDCHGTLSQYNEEQPRGRQFKPNELKLRREQVYERHTCHLVPPTRFVVSPDPRGLPCARFEAHNLGDYPPTQALITLTMFVDRRMCGIVDGAHYNGSTPVNLNPRHGFSGWFELPKAAARYKEYILVRVDATLIDPHERHHKLLPFGFMRTKDADWYYEPSPALFDRTAKQRKSKAKMKTSTTSKRKKK